MKSKDEAVYDALRSVITVMHELLAFAPGYPGVDRSIMDLTDRYRELEAAFELKETD